MVYINRLRKKDLEGRSLGGAWGTGCRVEGVDKGREKPISSVGGTEQTSKVLGGYLHRRH